MARAKRKANPQAALDAKHQRKMARKGARELDVSYAKTDNSTRTGAKIARIAVQEGERKAYIEEQARVKRNENKIPRMSTYFGKGIERDYMRSEVEKQRTMIWRELRKIEKTGSVVDMLRDRIVRKLGKDDIQGALRTLMNLLTSVKRVKA